MRTLLAVFVALVHQVNIAHAFQKGDLAAFCEKKTWFNAPTQYLACVGKVLGQDGSGNYLLEHKYGGTFNSASGSGRTLCPRKGAVNSVPPTNLVPLRQVHGGLCSKQLFE